MALFPDGDPVVLHISQDQKTRIIDRVPNNLIRFDLESDS
jgi:hypothetical protein